MKKLSFGKTVAKISLSILATALSVSAQQNPEIAPRALPTVAGPNDIARFLAGMPLPENSPLAPLTRDPAWQEHSAFFEKEFTKLNLRELGKLHAWEETYFPEATQPIPVAFYMFSGPDLLYVDQFFPKASVYVLCGKESMGPPPDPLRIANLRGALQNLENAMSSALSYSFFITKDMKVDLESQELRGTLPILYVFIARADKSIMHVTFAWRAIFEHESRDTHFVECERDIPTFFDNRYAAIAAAGQNDHRRLVGVNFLRKIYRKRRPRNVL